MFLPILQNFSCKVSDFYNHPLSIKLVSILLRETFLPFSSLYREVFWNSKKWEDLSSLYCARSKGRRNPGEGLESAGIWVKQRKLLCYRFTVFTLFYLYLHWKRGFGSDIKKLKEQQRWQLRKRHWKIQSTSINFNQLQRAHSILFNFLNVDNFFLELNSKRLCQSSRKEKESLVLCSCPPQNVK